MAHQIIICGNAETMNPGCEDSYEEEIWSMVGDDIVTEAIDEALKKYPTPDNVDYHVNSWYHDWNGGKYSTDNIDGWEGCNVVYRKNSPKYIVKYAEKLDDAIDKNICDFFESAVKEFKEAAEE